MRTANTKSQPQTITSIVRQIIIMLATLVESICKALIVALPFILIEDRQEIEFWQAVGYYGVFLFGIATIYGRLSPSRSRGR